MNDEQPMITSPADTMDDGVGAITPSTVSSGVLPQWSQLMPDVQARKRIGTTPVSSSSSSDSDEQDDDDELTTPWQSMNDLPERRVMVQRIITLTEKKSAIVAAQQQQQDQSAATLAKRIELSLYSRAHSLDEYRNLTTLRRRLQSLVALSYHEATAERAMQEQQQALSPKRRLLLARHLDLTPDFNIKRRRVVVGLSDVEETKTNSSSSGGERGFLFQRIGDDCVRNIFSFLDGREVIANRVLSRFASEFLPSCILRLQLSVQQLQHCLDSDDLFSLYRLSNLEQLVITNSSSPQNPEQQQQHGVAGPLHAWGCAELDATQSNDGEYVVARLAAALDAGAGRHLKQLHLVSVFTNTRQRNGVRALCDALAHGACPQLEDLLLGGNSITDAGTSHIARLLKVRDAVPRLARLDLRRNYIGEAGLYKIVSALAKANTTQLRYLCLGGNVITDNCVPPLQELLLAGRACPQLRFLGLEDNFLSPDGVQTIIQAAASSGMVPKLHRVCSSDDGAIL
jgi:tyrosine-protein phosphatase OCA1|uniref:F-box domain-containing protein n=1 Tax=Globisporangium ultimum (strain ATCC 200006 / CBS 805.95 / DAOM BR144) TaxID=431595 RepID=K3X7D8_GLOUD